MLPEEPGSWIVRRCFLQVVLLIHIHAPDAPHLSIIFDEWYLKWVFLNFLQFKKDPLPLLLSIRHLPWSQLRRQSGFFKKNLMLILNLNLLDNYICPYANAVAKIVSSVQIIRNHINVFQYMCYKTNVIIEGIIYAMVNSISKYTKFIIIHYYTGYHYA